jgi:hypothetical protein
MPNIGRRDLQSILHIRKVKHESCLCDVAHVGAA